ncbi:succinic semialdehyde dehydrogenase [Compostimonas suwonensis]|uniref:Succinate-semialdehyde dehydrogenase/glutarate-semialdehyde dehydrogenase n=1 Tax=Compostimonas suwonensis TaxID=1048394 RepID=A0A2M9BWD7_9MICO|nr:succinic semialdehyde dehydrogenase [Compostimonas suwonensis]PJJ62268.1 succinate-semialdehyde dehydrogenase/glutarate-semialdehyde dehydrogenase [Compostimonas suwonensis]
MTGTPLDSEIIADLDHDISTSTGSTVTVFQPYTGEALHELPVSSADDVDRAYARARLAQLAWARSGFAHRRAVLLRAHDLLLAREELLLDVVQSETGKTRGQAFEELFQCAGVVRYNALAARPVLRARRRRAGIPTVVSTQLRYRPKGVVGVITPWNYPLSLGIMDVVPALAAGNGVVQKADEQGALSVLAARRAFIEAGVPAELWAVVTGDGDGIGNAVTTGADYVCFTGSTTTGTKVAALAAQNLTGVSLELGGKNPLLVLDDVDPREAAANAVYACFSSMGQLCVSIERIYVQRRVADAFLAAFVAKTQSLVQGAAYDWSTDVGTLVSPAQLARVERHVDDAVGKGATVLTGGEARPELGPYFYAPTVLTDVTPSMLCFAQETFGPVVSVYVVDSVDEAVRAANASEFGLSAAVFSGSSVRGMRVARQIEAGSVNVNEGYRATFSSIDAPMGGVKQSGLGRRNGPEGLLRFVEPVTIARTTGLLTLPRTGAEFQAMTGIMRLLVRALKAVRRR